MTVCKKLILKISLVAFIIVFPIANHASTFLMDKTLSFSGAIGTTFFPEYSDQTIKITDYVSDLLVYKKNHQQVSFNLNAKKQLKVPTHTVSKITLGPAFYYQKAHHSGEVWELALPVFYNYDYHLTSETYDFLLEGDVYLKPIKSKIIPFFTAGLGFGIAKTAYNDHALPGIPLNSELHLSKTNTKAIYELGAGLAVPLNTHWSLNLRYAYFIMSEVNTSSHYSNGNLQPFTIAMNNQNLLLGVNYTL